MSVHELESLPSLGRLYARAALGSLLPSGGGGSELGEVSATLRGARVDPVAVAEYARVCGFTLRDTLPATYPHMLAFPLQLELMTSGEFPFDLLGMVHVANRIEQLAPIALSEELDLRVWPEAVRPHRRGTQVDLVAEASAAGALAWRSRSTYLRRGEGAAEGVPDEAIEVLPGDAWAEALWKVPGDIGRRYAAVSGDRNPIHLHPLTAKAFGFPRAIAHGMWTKARALAAFEGRLPDAFTVAVDFRAPLLLPSTASFRSRAGGDGWSFVLQNRNGSRDHLTGRIEGK